MWRPPDPLEVAQGDLDAAEAQRGRVDRGEGMALSRLDVPTPLKRAIQSYIQNPLAVKLLQGEILPGQTVRVLANGDTLEFKTDQAFATA